MPFPTSNMNIPMTRSVGRRSSTRSSHDGGVPMLPKAIQTGSPGLGWCRKPVYVLGRNRVTYTRSQVIATAQSEQHAVYGLTTENFPGETIRSTLPLVIDETMSSPQSGLWAPTTHPHGDLYYRCFPGDGKACLCLCLYPTN